MAIQLPSYLKGKKASDAFLEYVEPFWKNLLLDRIKHGIHEEPSIKETEHIFKVPWCIWNAVVSEKDPKNKTDLIAMFKILTAHLPESIQSSNDFMIKRKRTFFGEYEYYLGKYKFFYNENEELRFRMECSLPIDTIVPPKINII